MKSVLIHRNWSSATQLINLFFSQFDQRLVGNSSYKLLSNGKVSISIPYFSSAFLVISSQQMKALSYALSQVMNYKIKNVEVRVIKLGYPYLDGTVLAKYIALNANKYAFARIHKVVFKKRAFFDQISLETPNSPAAFATNFNRCLPYRSKGIKLELAGRLTTQQSIPRKTVANKHIGSGLSRSSTKSFRYASKNKLGAYTVKVWLS